jgi:DNA-directed RNA polymerase II subunit RPB1
MSNNTKYYNENIKEIDRIEFNIFSNSEIKKYSAVSKDPFGINVPDSYDNYEPKKGGLVDLRLGTCDPYLHCTTCGLNSLDCPGHFGHTELAEPVFHYGFLNHLVSTLKCVCVKCSNILIEKNDKIMDKYKNKKGKYRFKLTKDLVKNINFCQHCGTPVPKIKKEVKEATVSVKVVLEKEVGNVIVDDKTGIKSESVKVVKEELTPRQCYNILRNISDVDVFLLGFNANESRPEDMIIQRFPIPPTSIRPTAKIDFLASATMEDSLTLKIADIISTNIKVRNQMNKDSSNPNLENLNTLLQYHIAIYFDNDSSSLPKSEFKAGNRPIKSISDRVKAKEGRIRTNLMGKRVDFSARSVITSDPNIDIDEVGIPLRVAMNLTIPEEVTPKNIDEMTKLLFNGSEVYPGANFVFKTININGKEIQQRIDLKYRKKNITLNFGDIVERHIVNGDYVLFNRQPTLHKPSMMGHKIHVLERDDVNTFRMNVNVTKPYGADFDGDEMNIHLAQSIQARNELENIATCKYQIIGAKNSEPIIGCVQDSLIGAYLLSIDNDISYNLSTNLLSSTKSKSKSSLKKEKNFSGLDVFSHIIPKGINSLKKSGDNVIINIKNGELIEGKLDNSQLSTQKNSIHHYIWDKYGATDTQQFIDNVQRLTINYLNNRGFSIGFKDTIIDDETIASSRELINSKVLLVKHMITQFENEKDNIDLTIIEDSIKSELNTVMPNIGKVITDTLDVSNAFYALLKSGAKGSAPNIAQIVGCMGQISHEGSRINKSVNGRALVGFHKHDDTPSARGFIQSNLLEGLKGSEFFFASIAGRSGLIDGAIKTAETGYIQRKLIKALEDLYQRYDGTVRTSDNIIVQHLYGESGIDQVKQTQQKIKVIDMDNDEIKKIFMFSNEEIKKLSSKYSEDINKINSNIYKNMIRYRDDLRQVYYKSTLNYKILEDSFMLPVNFYRLTQEYSEDTNKEFNLNPKHVLDSIGELLNDYDNRLIVLMDKNNKLLKRDEKNYKFIYRVALNEYLSPKKCIFKYNLSKNSFDNLIKDIKLSFTKSLVEPGEMVGVIAAQSIGEPTSQMTLDSKHSAGQAGKKSVTLSGLPRVKEIFSYSKNMKTPSTMVFFNENIHTNKKDVNRVASYFKHLTIKELINTAEIYYDTDGNDSLSKILKDDNAKNPFYINNDKVDIKNLPFVFRLTMNIESMMDKETTLLDIKTKFITYWYKNFSTLKNIKRNLKDVLMNVDNLAILSNNSDIIHIRFKMSNYNYNLLTTFLNIVLDTITLKGIDNINGTILNHEMIVNFDNSGKKVIDKEYVVETEGINLIGLKYLKGIDHNRTIINDVNLTYRYYGIEAARSIIVKELVSAFGSGGAGINYTHISLLVDFMTHPGEIISIDRHGLNKIDNEPLSKASFEKTMEHFVNAALFNETDYLESVSSKVLVGKVVTGGTGAFDLLFDTEKIKSSEYIIDEGAGRTDFVKIEKDNLFEDIIKFGNNELDFIVPT